MRWRSFAPPTCAIVVSLEAAMVVLDDPDVGIYYSRVVHGEQRFAHHRPIRAGDRLVATTTMERRRPEGPTTARAAARSRSRSTLRHRGRRGGWRRR